MRRFLAFFGLTTHRPPLREVIISASYAAWAGSMLPLVVIPGAVASVPEAPLFGLVAVVSTIVLAYVVERGIR